MVVDYKQEKPVLTWMLTASAIEIERQVSSCSQMYPFWKEILTIFSHEYDHRIIHFAVNEMLPLCLRSSLDD